MKKLLSFACILLCHYADAQNGYDTLGQTSTNTKDKPRLIFRIDPHSGWSNMLNISDRDTLKFPPVQNWTLLPNLTFPGWAGKQKDVPEKEWKLAADSLKKNTWDLHRQKDWGPPIWPD